MAVSVSGFLAEFPEFVLTNTNFSALVLAKLTAATPHVSRTLWADRYEHAVYLKTAHMLAMSPNGESMRLHKYSEKTVYSQQWDEEIRALPVRMLVP